MPAYLARRLWQFLPTLFGVVLLVFVLFSWVGGDPAYLLAGKISNPEQIENIRRQLGVDRPYYVQLLIFIRQIATGDFGASWATNERISDILATRLGPSLTVLVPMLVVGTVMAMAAAMLVAYLRGSLTDRAIMIGCTVGQSVSILVYILVFRHVLAHRAGSMHRAISPEPPYSALPIIVGVVVSLAPDTRLYRSFFLDEINQDYVRTARAKGMSEPRVMWVHVLRNAAIPIITNVMIQVPGLLAGAFLIERFFSIPGIGREVILAVERSDFPLIKAVTVYVAIATMVLNLVADLLYKAVDPRVQLK
jgi:peptide/nickel transport system permease protein